jgi:hypothetical protein
MDSMHTQSYKAFLRQYQAQGREKLDGYSSSHFDGLSADERLEVFDLLRKSLLDANDDTAIYGLAYLDPQRALEVFNEFDRKIDTYSIEYPKLYYWIHVITKSSSSLNKLLECGEQGSYYTKLETITHIEKLPNYCTILKWLKSRIFVETEAVVVHAASAELLRRYGISRNTHRDYSTLIELLTKPRISERKAGIQRLETQESDCIEIPTTDNSHALLEKSCSQETSPLTKGRALPHQPCPKTGFWYTPARQGSRRYFNAGEVMPDFPDSKYGETIWYWDQQQG